MSFFGENDDEQADKLAEEFEREIEQEDYLEAALDEFERKVRQRVQLLDKKKVSSDQRVKLVYWLGESGDIQAIPALVKQYRLLEKNKELKSPLGKALTYALGQFRALEQELHISYNMSYEDALDARPDIQQKLEDIAVRGEFGRRKTFPNWLFVGANLILGVLFVALVVVNGIKVMDSLGGGHPLPTQVIAESPEQLAVEETLRELNYRTLRNAAIAQSLRDQFGNALAGGSLTCEPRFVMRETDYVPSDVAQAAYAELSGLAVRVNEISEQINRAIDRHNTACREMAGKPDYNTSGEATRILDPVMIALPILQETLEDLLVQIEDATISAGRVLLPTLAPTETPLPVTETPVPTVAPAIVDSHRLTLDFMIEEVRSPTTGVLALLMRYWEDVRVSGSTGGCNVTLEEVPPDYTTPITADVEAVLPELVQARDNINLAMQMIRESHAVFESACASSALPNNLMLGQQLIQTADFALTEAQALLDTVVSKQRETPES